MGQMRVTSCRSLPSRLTQTAPCPLPVTMGRGRWAAHGVSLTDSGTEARRVPVMCFTEPQGWDHHAGRQPRALAGDELDALPRTSEPASLPVIVPADTEFAGCCPQPRAPFSRCAGRSRTWARPSPSWVLPGRAPR